MDRFMCKTLQWENGRGPRGDDSIGYQTKEKWIDVPPYGEPP